MALGKGLQSDEVVSGEALAEDSAVLTLHHAALCSVA